MTISVHQALNTATQYGDYGLTAGAVEQSQEVSYTVRRIEDFDNKMATAVFTVEIGGVAVAEPYRFMFTYSGEGNPFEQAEPALKAFLEKQAAEAAMQGADPVETQPEQQEEAQPEQEQEAPETASEAAPEVLSN